MASSDAAPPPCSLAQNPRKTRACVQLREVSVGCQLLELAGPLLKLRQVANALLDNRRQVERIREGERMAQHSRAFERFAILSERVLGAPAQPQHECRIHHACQAGVLAGPDRKRAVCDGIVQRDDFPEAVLRDSELSTKKRSDARRSVCGEDQLGRAETLGVLLKLRGKRSGLVEFGPGDGDPPQPEQCGKLLLVIANFLA